MTLISSSAIVPVVTGCGIWVFCLMLLIGSRCFSEPVRSEAGDGNRRSLARFSVSKRADIQVFDGETECTAKAYLLNMNEYGACIRFGSNIPVGTPLVLRIPEISSAVTARVRTSSKGWFGYQIGLEFKGTLYRMP